MVVQEVELGSVMQEASPEQVAASHLPVTTLGREEAEEKVVVQELELGSWCAGGCRRYQYCDEIRILSSLFYSSQY